MSVVRFVYLLALGVWLGEHMPQPIGNVEELVIGPFPEADDSEADDRPNVVRAVEELGVFADE